MSVGTNMPVPMTPSSCRSERAPSLAAPGALPARLEVELREERSACVLVLNGALTGMSKVALEVQIEQLSYSSFDEVVLDLQGLTAIDEVGAALLNGLDVRTRARRARLVVVGAAPDVVAGLAGTSPAVEA
jgi:anti-anti-sigma factor